MGNLWLHGRYLLVVVIHSKGAVRLLMLDVGKRPQTLQNVRPLPEIEQRVIGAKGTGIWMVVDEIG